MNFRGHGKHESIRSAVPHIASYDPASPASLVGPGPTLGSAPTNPTTGRTTIVRRKAPTTPGDHFCCWPNADVETRLSIRPLSGVKRTCAVTC